MMAKVFVRPDGTVEGLHTDAIPLYALGKLIIKRATTIEFCNIRQKWIVALPSGRNVFSHVSRQKALTWERKYCENLLQNGFRP